MLNDALEELKDNGISPTIYDSVVRDLFRNDNFSDVDEKRYLVCYQYYRENVAELSPSGCSVSNGCWYTVECEGEEFLVALDEDEAINMCRDCVEESLWAFKPDFLASMTGLSKEVFEVLAQQCEGANEAVHALVDSSCGLGVFVDAAIAADGRGHFLATYDGEEREFEFAGKYYYLYRVN